MNIMSDNNETTRKRLGEKVRKAREKARLTQAEVAEKADINVSYYAQIERGEVNLSIDKLQSIAKVLKIKSLDIV
jgi:transcriptional regulator with XRE-family HTH domain